ncbi:Sec-independent protein translocase protein TatB [Bordetella genomosp. 13]|uniref:Sec-independent protein translocase protein TatB n=1 Tax=Bordetella genomosp. 13 TaxID=463040 RepID=A0A1W6Z6K3_9BORD|nr:Sec-independent protein translocase protein TatB [Bordetella genomosp. 13]ARP93056.1 twin-arginine translocase subunit TatB [Bordetella genomosp. 13]
MFDVSFTELLIIGVVALVVLGPERLPKVARTVGHLLGRAQRYVSDVKSDIQREIELEELRKFKENMDTAASEMQTSLRETESSLRADLDATAREAKQAVAATAQNAQASLSTAAQEAKDALAEPQAAPSATAPAGPTTSAAVPAASASAPVPDDHASRTIAPPVPAPASEPAAAPKQHSPSSTGTLS